MDVIDKRDRLIVLAAMIADEYHMEPGLIMNLETEIDGRVIHVEISVKEAE